MSIAKIQSGNAVYSYDLILEATIRLHGETISTNKHISLLRYILLVSRLSGQTFGRTVACQEDMSRHNSR